MQKPKLVRITTVPLSLDKLLEGQLRYMAQFFDITAVSSESEKLIPVANREGVSWFHVPFTRKITPIKDLKALWILYRFLLEKRPNVVHTHTPKAGLIGILAAYMAGVPIRLHTVAGLPLMEASGFKRWVLIVLERITYRLSTKVYPNSRGLFEYILSQKLTTSPKLKIIGEGSSNGIDTNYFDPSLFTENEKYEIRTQLNIPSSSLVFSFIGRIVGDKGVNELVEAFINATNYLENLYLVLVGPLESELDPLDDKTLDNIRQHPNIRSVGYQQDVRPYLAISDLLIFPSYREGFPNVVMQALAMEVPVIASNINGCNELIVHGENGWLVPAKDTVALEQQIRSILEQPNVMQTIKKRTRSSIVMNFQRENIWKLLYQEYEELIGENS